MTNDGLKLSGEEIAIAEKHIAKFEKTARQWRSRRYFMLGVALFSLFCSIQLLDDFVKHGLFDQTSIVEKIPKEKIPEDVPSAYSGHRKGRTHRSVPTMGHGMSQGKFEIRSTKSETISNLA